MAAKNTFGGSVPGGTTGKPLCTLEPAAAQAAPIAVEDGPSLVKMIWPPVIPIWLVNGTLLKTAFSPPIRYCLAAIAWLGGDAAKATNGGRKSNPVLMALAARSAATNKCGPVTTT